MKETILITGAGPNGVTGRRIKELLEADYNILSPGSKELDLTDTKQVDQFFNDYEIDYVIHSAVLAPSRGHDNSSEDKELENNLKMFFNLTRHSSDFKKMFYFGSGAEFDKRQEIVTFKEEDYLSRIPEDKYGFIKYILNSVSAGSRNIYNLRLFGVINPYEPPTRNVVSNLCAKAVLGQDLNLRRNCKFSFIDIDDVVKFIKYGIENELKHHSYNMSSGVFYIDEIANIVLELSNRYIVFNLNFAIIKVVRLD